MRWSRPGARTAPSSPAHCVGWDKLRAYVLGETDGVAKTPDWAAAITHVPAETIRRLALECADKPTMLTAAWSLQRADYGEQPYWMLAALAGMLGDDRQAGPRRRLRLRLAPTASARRAARCRR